ncbi:cAMP-specific 3' [Conglomerata obtusa]
MKIADIAKIRRIVESGKVDMRKVEEMEDGDVLYGRVVGCIERYAIGVHEEMSHCQDRESEIADGGECRDECYDLINKSCRNFNYLNNDEMVVDRNSKYTGVNDTNNCDNNKCNDIKYENIINEENYKNNKDLTFKRISDNIKHIDLKFDINDDQIVLDNCGFKDMNNKYFHKEIIGNENLKYKFKNKEFKNNETNLKYTDNEKFYSNMKDNINKIYCEMQHEEFKKVVDDKSKFDSAVITVENAKIYDKENFFENLDSKKSKLGFKKFDISNLHMTEKDYKQIHDRNNESNLNHPTSENACEKNFKIKSNFENLTSNNSIKEDNSDNNSTKENNTDNNSTKDNNTENNITKENNTENNSNDKILTKNNNITSETTIKNINFTIKTSNDTNNGLFKVCDDTNNDSSNAFNNTKCDSSKGFNINKRDISSVSYNNKSDSSNGINNLKGGEYLNNDKKLYHNNNSTKNLVEPNFLINEVSLVDLPPLLSNFSTRLTLQESSNLLYTILHTENLLLSFHITIPSYLRFINTVIYYYNHNIYHNIYHAFDILFTSYYLYKKIAHDYLPNKKLLIALLLSALMHDIGHLGFTSDFVYQYGEVFKKLGRVSLNEKIHVKVAHTILRSEMSLLDFKRQTITNNIDKDNIGRKDDSNDINIFDINILDDLCSDVQTLIMSTDLTQHDFYVQQMQNAPIKDLKNQNIKTVIEIKDMIVLIKVADIASTSKSFEMCIEIGKLVAMEMEVERLIREVLNNIENNKSGNIENNKCGNKGDVKINEGANKSDVKNDNIGKLMDNKSCNIMDGNKGDNIKDEKGNITKSNFLKNDNNNNAINANNVNNVNKKYFLEISKDNDKGINKSYIPYKTDVKEKSVAIENERILKSSLEAPENINTKTIYLINSFNDSNKSKGENESIENRQLESGETISKESDLTISNENKRFYDNKNINTSRNINTTKINITTDENTTNSKTIENINIKKININRDGNKLNEDGNKLNDDEKDVILCNKNFNNNLPDEEFNENNLPIKEIKILEDQLDIPPDKSNKIIQIEKSNKKIEKEFNFYKDALFDKICIYEKQCIFYEAFPLEYFKKISLYYGELSFTYLNCLMLYEKFVFLRDEKRNKELNK